MKTFLPSPAPISINPKSEISEHVVRLVIFDPSKNECYTGGTGVIIFGNMILTAAHIIDDIFEKQNRFNLTIKTENNNCEVECEFWIMQILPNDLEFYSVWTPLKIYRSRYSDMCLIQIAPYNDVAAKYKQEKRWKAPNLNLNPPLIGEEISIFGYRATEMKFSTNDNGGNHIDIQDKPTLSTGKVTRIYPVKRDSAMLPFPCFETNAYADHGMSGGVVFNKKGELCGIVSSSIHNDDKTIYTSYIAILWPLMASNIDIEIDKNLINQSLLDLIDKKILDSKQFVGYDFLSVNGGQISNRKLIDKLE